MAGFSEKEYEQSNDSTPTDPPKGSEQNSGVNAPELESTPPPAVSQQQQVGSATAGIDHQIKTIQDWMDAEENRPETPWERKKRERREKSKRIIAAVSDGISALSNLYFTSQYAPNMYNHEKGSMLKAEEAHLDKLKAEREANAERYRQYALKLGDLENKRDATLREIEAQQEKRKLAREKAKREEEEHNWNALLQPDKQREQAGKANKAEQDAIVAQAEAEAAPALQQAKVETEKARKNSLDASAANSRASASAHNRSNVAEFSAWDERGREHKFHTAAAAEAFAKQHGTWQETEEKETTDTETRRSPNSQPQTRTSTKTKQGGHPKIPAPADNTPPSRRNNNSNTPPSRR